MPRAPDAEIPSQCLRIRVLILKSYTVYLVMGMEVGNSGRLVSEQSPGLQERISVRTPASAHMLIETPVSLSQYPHHSSSASQVSPGD